MWRMVATIAIALAPGFASPAGTQVLAQDNEPAVELDTPRAPLGSVVRLEGAGFQPGDILVVSLCGNLALRGSLDCDYANTRVAGVTADGRLPQTTLPVTSPPMPCPCVITVASRTGNTLVEVPFEIMGVASAQPTIDIATNMDASTGAPEIVDLALFRDGPWTSWFGGSSRWTARVTITNPGPEPARPDLAMTFGRTDDPTGFIAVPTFDAIEAGARTTIELPFELESLAYGDYVVRAELGGDERTAVLRQMTTYPWGLFVLGAVLALVVLTSLLAVAVRAVSAGQLRRSGARTTEPDDAAVAESEAGQEPTADPLVDATATGSLGRSDDRNDVNDEGTRTVSRTGPMS